MQIDPKWGAILNITVLIAGLIAAGTFQFAGIPADSVAIVKSVAFDISLVLTAANSVLHLYASSNPGPLAPPDPPKVVAATLAAKAGLPVLVALSLLSWASSPASAADAGTQLAPPVVAQHIVKKKAAVPPPAQRVGIVDVGRALNAYAAVTKTRPVVAPEPSGKTPSGKMQLQTSDVEQNPITLIQQFSVDDLNAALVDAQGQNPVDTVAVNCYTALIPIVQSNIANPLPAGPGLFQLAQKVRDFKALTANLQSPTGPLAALNTACAPWVLDGINTFIGLGTQVGLIAAGGGLPLPIHLPGFGAEKR
jgi:hypothetical protein